MDVRDRRPQDEFFIPTRDASLCAAWIALDDATIPNGCLWAIPGSHKPKVIYPMRKVRPSPVAPEPPCSVARPCHPGPSCPAAVPCSTTIAALTQPQRPTASLTRRRTLFPSSSPQAPASSSAGTSFTGTGQQRPPERNAATFPIQVARLAQVVAQHHHWISPRFCQPLHERGEHAAMGQRWSAARHQRHARYAAARGRAASLFWRAFTPCAILREIPLTPRHCHGGRAGPLRELRPNHRMQLLALGLPASRSPVRWFGCPEHPPSLPPCRAAVRLLT